MFLGVALYVSYKLVKKPALVDPGKVVFVNLLPPAVAGAEELQRPPKAGRLLGGLFGLSGAGQAREPDLEKEEGDAAGRGGGGSAVRAACGGDHEGACMASDVGAACWGGRMQGKAKVEGGEAPVGMERAEADSAAG